MPKMKSKSPLKTSGKTPQVTLFPRPPSPPQKKQKSNIKKRSKSATTPATAAKVFPTSDLSKPAKTETKKSKLNVAPVAPVKAVKKVKIVAEKKSAPAPPPKPSSPPKIDEQETSQMWILRHLRLHLEDINDSILANFVLQQDVTPFRNFMLDFNNEKRCIFVLVCRQNQQLSLSIPASLLFKDAPTTPRSLEASEVIAPPDPIQKPISSDTTKPASGAASEVLQKPTPGKLMKPRAKSKKRTKSKEPKKSSSEKENNYEKREEAKRQIIDEIVQNEISAVPNQDGILQLKWSNSRKIPDETDEFVFVVSREAERMEEKSELDQSYFVGYCKNSRSFKRLIEIGTLILGSKMTFERQMDMLLFANNALAGNPPSTREKWQNKIEKFENFICDSLGQAFWRQSSEINNNNQSRADSILSLTEQLHSSVESVESLLRPRIIAFVKEANTTTRIRLWLELSLYELKFVKVEDSAKLTADRITRIHAIFQTLTLLLAEKESISTKEWLQKALFYTIELFARILGTNLKECVAELTADLFEESENNQLKVDPNSRIEIKPFFIKFIQIGLEDLYNPKSEEFGVLENIKQCLKIFEYIEEELEKMNKEVLYLRSPIHDMLIDRSPINNAFEILKNVWNMFQETYFESALESGNIETMKSVCLQISSEQEKLKALTDDLKRA